MKLTLIAAMDENRLIGMPDGGLPWCDLDRDKKHFRSYTADKALLLGRRTFEEMRGWFDGGHRPIVLSTNLDFVAGEYPVVNSVKAAVGLAKAWGEEALVVCGGASVYEAALPHATDLILTIVHHRFDVGEGGVHFPEWEAGGFVERQRDWWGAGEGNPFAMTILRLARARKGPSSSG